MATTPQEDPDKPKKRPRYKVECEIISNETAQAERLWKQIGKELEAELGPKIEAELGIKKGTKFRIKTSPKFEIEEYMPKDDQNSVKL